MIKSLLISSLTLIHFIGIVICQSHDIFGNYQFVYPSLLSNGSEFDGVCPRSCQELYDFFKIQQGWYFIKPNGEEVQNVLCLFENKQSYKDGLIHFWPIKNNVKDLIGSNDLYGDNIKYTYDQNGNQNSAINFDGTNFLSLNKYITDAFAGDFTVCIWVRFNYFVGSYDRVFDFGRSGQQFLLKTSRGKLQLYKKGQSNQTFEFIEKINLNEWYHISISVEGNNLIGYLNGKEDSRTQWTDLPIKISTEGKYYVGSTQSQSKSKLYFSDFMIFDRTLNADEILTLKNLKKYTTQLIK